MRYKIILLVVVGLLENCLLTNFINGEHIFPGPQALPWKQIGCGSPIHCFAMALPVVLLFRNRLGQINIGPTRPARTTPTTPARTTPTTPARTTPTTPARTTSTTPARTTSTTPARTTPTTPARTTPTTPTRTTPTTPARTTPTTPARTTPTTLAPITTTAAPACPPNYSLYDESCGRFCYRIQSSVCLNWYDAQEACKREEGGLLEPNECNYNFFRVQAMKNQGRCAGYFWLVAVRTSEGNIRTVSGDLISKEASFWGTNQPDNRGGFQNCLEISAQLDFMVDDEEFNAISSYICTKI